jgi:Zn ribbon nucleic-acid-binding protein
MGLVLLLGGAGGADATLSEFARCLTSAGARFYGTSWCPHCAAQRTMFGAAFSEVSYVECSVNGTKETTAECQAAGVTSYPTWTFRDGSRATGALSLERLASRTGCPYEHGPMPQIIDVPAGRGSVRKLPGAEDVEIIELP